jgi:hypothetical protein
VSDRRNFYLHVQVADENAAGLPGTETLDILKTDTFTIQK